MEVIALFKNTMSNIQSYYLNIVETTQSFCPQPKKACSRQVDG
jgi:hypothetical protein